MKVAVITRHAITNYGSLLQTIATQKVIEKLGHSCEIIDYVRADESYKQHEKTLLKTKENWNKNPITRWMYLLLRQPESILAGKQFEKYQNKYLNLTRRYSSISELKGEKPIADVYVTGSDQVWGPTEDRTYDSVYCLSFTDDTDKRISYAASFGRTKFNDEIVKYYEKWLGRYMHITVREDSAVEILNGMGIVASQVLDPTLLIPANEWQTMISKPVKQEYILVYQLHNDKRLGEYAEKVAKKKGLKLIRISASLHQITRKGKFVWKPDIGEFLSYIKNANCMITDSFHGTAFAINFNTPFIEVLPNNNTGTRNMSILNLTKLTSRVLLDENNLELIDEPIDFSESNFILERKRAESIQILKQMIEC